MKPSIKLFTIGGIEIGVHYTWIFAFILIAWSLAKGQFPVAFPLWSDAQYWGAGIASSLVLFISVLLHELAHSLMAKRKGLPVKGITLFIFGGVSNIGAESRRAWDEFIIAIVGPLTSIAIGLIFLLLWNKTGPTFGRLATPIQGVIFYGGLINIAVGLFNLLPGFPLDGGRVLRAIVWGATGNMRRATNIAADVGRLVAWAMIGYGLYRVFTGDILGGIWMAFIGWFLNSAADSAKREQETERVLSGTTVRDIMQPDPVIVRPDMPVEELVRDCFIRRGCRAVPVVDAAGRLAGIVSLSDVRRLGQAEWASTAVAAVMTRDPLHTVAPGEGVEVALRLLAEKDINQAVVVDGGQVVGLIGREGMMRFVRIRRELRLTGPDQDK